jgi:integrase
MTERSKISSSVDERARTNNVLAALSAEMKRHYAEVHRLVESILQFTEGEDQHGTAQAVISEWMGDAAEIQHASSTDRKSLKLTDVAVRKAAVNPDKAVRIADELGLYLDVSPKGIKSWRLRIRSDGRNTIKTLGRYPEMTLADARRARAIERGIIVPVFTPPPIPSFETVARDWHETNKVRWTVRHGKRVLHTLVQEIFPELGSKPIDTIEAPAIMALLKAIEATGRMDHAHDVRQRVEGVFWYAVAAGFCKTNPASSMSRVMKPIPPSKPRPAIIELDKVRKVLAHAETIPSGPIVRLAHRFLALTAQRPGEIRAARWAEFGDLEAEEPVWSIPGEHMKMKKPHWVPLSHQAVEVLTELKKLTGKFDLAFPSNLRPNVPISGTAIGDLLERAGYAGRHVPHGWRASFSTIMNGRRRDDRAIIDQMLAHVPKDQIEGAYNRQLHMEVKRQIAQEWADILLAGMPAATAMFRRGGAL